MSTNATDALDHEVEVVHIDEPVVMSGAERAAIDVQVATAKRYPRSIARFRKEAESLALLDEETAGECFYAVPRSGKTIEGPSARLAEIIAFAWGNMRADAEVTEQDRTHVTAMGTCFDLERNVAIRVRVKRRITDKNGRTLNEDMIGVISNAAISIALRNAVFKVVPKALWKPIYEKARRASLGQGGTLTQKRQAMLDWFRKLGVDEARICEALGVDGIEDVKEDQLITLRGLANAIKEGETTVDDAFGRRGAQGTGTSELRERMRDIERQEAQEHAEPPLPDAPAGDPIQAEDEAPPPWQHRLDQAKAAETARGADVSGDLGALAEQAGRRTGRSAQAQGR